MYQIKHFLKLSVISNPILSKACLTRLTMDIPPGFAESIPSTFSKTKAWVDSD